MKGKDGRGRKKGRDCGRGKEGKKGGGVWGGGRRLISSENPQ